MNRSTWIATCALALGAAALFVTLSRAGSDRRAVAVEAPRVGGVHRIVSAQPFVLSQAWTHGWRAERPRYDAGWLVVLEVDAALVEPRNTAEPVLYAGNETVERVNHGFESGRVVAIVPSTRGPDGAPALDLARVPFWFGAAELPERITLAGLAAERAAAAQRGVAPLAPPAAKQLLRLENRDELDAIVAILGLEHAPAEQDLWTGMLAPRVR